MRMKKSDVPFDSSFGNSFRIVYDLCGGEASKGRVTNRLSWRSWRMENPVGRIQVKTGSPLPMW